MFSPARRYGLSGAECVSEQNISRHRLGRPTAAESYSADGVFNSSGRLKVFQKWLNINWEL
jgi:hypothetical protein